jgi:hypothetical protein
MSPADDAATRRTTTSATLAKAAVACLVLGWIVGSPAGAMFLHTLAAVFALPAVLMARGNARFLPGVVLGVALAMTIVTYPQYREHMAAYAAKAQR